MHLERVKVIWKSALIIQVEIFPIKWILSGIVVSKCNSLLKKSLYIIAISYSMANLYQVNQLLSISLCIYGQKRRREGEKKGPPKEKFFLFSFSCSITIRNEWLMIAHSIVWQFCALSWTQGWVRNVENVKHQSSVRDEHLIKSRLNTLLFVISRSLFWFPLFDRCIWRTTRIDNTQTCQ